MMTAEVWGTGPSYLTQGTELGQEGDSVMRPQAEGQIATTFVATSCQEQQSVVSRDLQSALLLCCSAALYALWT